MLESELKKRLVKVVKAENGWAQRIEDRYRVGTPDLDIIYPSFNLRLEVKILEGKAKLWATPTQQLRIAQINEVGNKAVLAACLGYRPRESMLAIGFPGDAWDEAGTLAYPLRQPLVGWLGTRFAQLHPTAQRKAQAFLTNPAKRRTLTDVNLEQ